MNEPALMGKVGLVTGGGRGLGAAICDVLSEAGASVVAGDIRFAGGPTRPEDFSITGEGPLTVHLDVSDEDSVDSAVQAVLDRFGRLDILVNNAGIDVTLPVEELSAEEWQRVVSVNLNGPFLTSKRAVPLMREQGSGHIVNIVSTAAKRAWPNAAAYHASKWGLLGLSHALHAELRAAGIKVTAVVAGGMRTPFLLDRFPDIDVETLQDPRSVAETVRFVLCSPDGSVIPEVMVLPMRETSWP
jgi:NAD(P)-dependent dehydrogenase (short-subunit alcohol dehydrogenase family)